MKPFVQFYFLSNQRVRIETNNYEVSGETRDQRCFYSEEVSTALAYTFLDEVFNACVHGEVRVCVGDVPKAWCEDDMAVVITRFFRHQHIAMGLGVFCHDIYGTQQPSFNPIADYNDFDNSIYLDVLEFWDLARLYGTFMVVQ